METLPMYPEKTKHIHENELGIKVDIERHLYNKLECVDRLLYEAKKMRRNLSGDIEQTTLRKRESVCSVQFCVFLVVRV